LNLLNLEELILYNITVKVNSDIADAWIYWQINEHIPEIMSTKLFVEYKIFRLLDQDDREGPTFVTQFFASNINNYNRYVDEYAPALRNKALQKWADGFIAFRSVMQTLP
jgi:hypothetical protein